MAQIQTDVETLNERRVLAKTQRQTAIPALLAEIAQLPANTVFQTNVKTVNRVYLNLLASEAAQLTAVQFAEIKAIAEQCPQYGGAVVYRARMLYQINESRDFDLEDFCTPAEERSAAPIRQLPKAGIQPNPANNTMMLTLAHAGAGTQVQITDVNGRVFRTLEVTDQPSYTFDVSSWPSGLYFCTVHNSLGAASPLKLLIQH